MKTRLLPSLVIALASCGLLATSLQAGPFDFLKSFKPEKVSENPSDLMAGLSQGDMVAALKEALNNGALNAVADLSKDGGYLNSPDVRIPLPGNLSRVEKILRKLKQDEMADNLNRTINSAAEDAVMEAAPIFRKAISEITFADAQNILLGDDRAATDYFRRNTITDLKEKFLPIVAKATEASGATAAYKSVVEKGESISRFLSVRDLDLDDYVTDEALDGLFLRMAEEEKKIREQPAARTSELLQKVFSQIGVKK